MSVLSNLDIRQYIKVPSNSYLRHQYSRNKNTAIFTFLLGDQGYGFESRHVHETQSFDGVLKIAKMPQYIKGISKQGKKIFPVVDLRLYLALPSKLPCKLASELAVAECTDNNSQLIILNINQRQIGIMVDEILDPIFTKNIKLKPSSEANLEIYHQYYLSLAKTKARDYILIDIEKLMAEDALLSKVEAAALNTVIDVATEA